MRYEKKTFMVFVYSNLNPITTIQFTFFPNQAKSYITWNDHRSFSYIQSTFYFDLNWIHKQTWIMATFEFKLWKEMSKLFKARITFWMKHCLKYLTSMSLLGQLLRNRLLVSKQSAFQSRRKDKHLLQSKKLLSCLVKWKEGSPDR